jgi:hypothetical protein
LDGTQTVCELVAGVPVDDDDVDHNDTVIFGY